MFTDMIVAVGSPAECQAAKAAGFKTMSPAWHADNGIVTAPSPFFCDIVCVSGRWEGSLEALAKGLMEECGRFYARGLFLDFTLPAASWDALSSLFPKELRLFAPYQETMSARAKNIFWVSALPAAGEGFGEAVLRLPEGEAVYLPLIRRKTKITRGGPAEACPLSGEELAKVIQEKKPGIYRSSGQMADYFTLSSDGQTYFYLFDSKETLEEKLSLLQRRGIRTVFVLWDGLAPLLKEA